MGSVKAVLDLIPGEVAKLSADNLANGQFKQSTAKQLADSAVYYINQFNSYKSLVESMTAATDCGNSSSSSSSSSSTSSSPSTADNTGSD